ncbi:hypothetical protein ACQEVM_38445 [Streptomyces sp. CA-243310]|uniref:hypothetical protein n=1 Tax=Streptomyces sp. CA-243310 TaxID=3240056 RepID=UPI003D8E9582
MNRTPDPVATLDTHRLIVTVPNHGPADVRSNLPRPTAAAMLRHLADELAAEQPLAALPGETYAALTAQLAQRHRPAEAARLAANGLAHHTRELANLLAAVLHRGVPADAGPTGRYLVSILRSHAVRLDSPPRTAVDDVLDLAAARAARLAHRPPR